MTMRSFAFLEGKTEKFHSDKYNYHRSPMQTEKSKPEGKRILPETTCLPRVGISRSSSETDD